MSQPIHTTLKPQVKPERFELTWEMLENLHAASATSGYNAIIVFCAKGAAQSLEHLAMALEVILQHRTFSPGVFEHVNGRWQRAGSEPRHENLEGC